jgi:hypothetical protein
MGNKAQLLWAALVTISLLCGGCGPSVNDVAEGYARQCQIKYETAPAAQELCLMRVAQWRQNTINTQLYQEGIASQSLEKGLGSMQGLAEQNQRSAQVLGDQAEQFPRFQPPESVPPVGAGQGSGSVPLPYPNNLWSPGGLWNP